VPVPLPAKTLEAWVAPANLHQRGGGVVTLETTKKHGFDSIVYAEKEPKRWVAGSDHFSRSEISDGPQETAGPNEFVHGFGQKVWILSHYSIVSKISASGMYEGCTRKITGSVSILIAVACLRGLKINN